MKAFASILLASLLFACSSSSGSDTTGGSNDDGPGGHACIDYPGLRCELYEPSDAGTFTDFDCGAPSRTVTSCPTDNVRATCTFGLTDGEERIDTFYNGNPESDADAKADCDTLNGTYVIH